MALKSTVYKALLQIADLDRHHYDNYPLTLARHPSETEERLMLRLLAFALYADPALAFGRGLSAEDEPALWRRDLSGHIEQWIELGQPDERLLRRACGRADHVVVLTYGQAAPVWWSQHGDKLRRLENLDVLNLPASESQALAAFARRSLDLQCTLQDGHILLTAAESEPLTVTPQYLQRRPTH